MVVTSGGQIFRYTGSGFQQLPGAARDIGIGADGTAWVVGTNAVQGGYGIYRWNGSNWTGVSGGGTDISVGPDGSPYLVNSSKTIFASGGTIRWVPAAGGQVPAGAVAGGQEPARTLYLCRASYGQGANVGMHPGKIVGGACNIGWGGREVQLSSYQVMVAAGGGGSTANYGPLRAVYQSAKASTAETASAARYARQATLLTQLQSELVKLPSGDGARNEIQAVYGARSTAPAALNPDVLRDEYRQLGVLLAQLERLRRDPASPCGQAIKEVNATPQPVTKSVAGGAPPAAQPPARTAAPQPGVLGKQFMDMRRAALLKAGYGKAAVDATARMKQQQMKQRLDAMEAARRARLVAFANKVKQYEARNRQLIERAAAARPAAPPPRPAVPAAKQQRIAAQSALAASAAKQQAAQLHPRLQVMTPAQRAAFARAYEAQARPQPQARSVPAAPPATLPAAVVEQRTARARSAVAKLDLTDEQRQKLIAAMARAAPAERARLLRELPMAERASRIPGTPHFVAGPTPRGAPAPKPARPDQSAETLTVDPVILNNMRNLPRR